MDKLDMDRLDMDRLDTLPLVSMFNQSETPTPTLQFMTTTAEMRSTAPIGCWDSLLCSPSLV